MKNTKNSLFEIQYEPSDRVVRRYDTTPQTAVQGRIVGVEMIIDVHFGVLYRFVEDGKSIDEFETVSAAWLKKEALKKYVLHSEKTFLVAPTEGHEFKKVKERLIEFQEDFPNPWINESEFFIHESVGDTKYVFSISERTTGCLLVDSTTVKGAIWDFQCMLSHIPKEAFEALKSEKLRALKAQFPLM